MGHIHVCHWSLWICSRFFERSWLLGAVPENWNKRKHFPCLQEGENYGLIRLTSLPENVIENIHLEAISKHTRGKKASRSSQHRLTKDKSCMIVWQWIHYLNICHFLAKQTIFFSDLKAWWAFKIGIEAGIFPENQIVIISDWAHQTVDTLGCYRE